MGGFGERDVKTIVDENFGARGAALGPGRSRERGAVLSGEVFFAHLDPIDARRCGGSDVKQEGREGIAGQYAGRKRRGGGGRRMIRYKAFAVSNVAKNHSLGTLAATEACERIARYSSRVSVRILGETLPLRNQMDGQENIEHTETTNGTAKGRMQKDGDESGNVMQEIVLVPINRPGKIQEQGAHLETEHDQQCAKDAIHERAKPALSGGPNRRP